jgi:hypothetical protein
MLAHLCYDGIQRQGAVTAEKLNKTPAGTRTDSQNRLRFAYSLWDKWIINWRHSKYLIYPITSLGTIKRTCPMMHESNP